MKVKDLKYGRIYADVQTNGRFVIERGGFMNLRKVGVVRRWQDNGSTFKDKYSLHNGMLRELTSEETIELKKKKINN